MSLIEKEELAKKIADAISWYRVHSSMIMEKQLNYDKEIEVLTAMMSCIAQMPTVEAQPVRHGQWDYVTVVDEGFWRCSICGTPSEAIGAKKLYKYCPFCGARLDGEQEKHND